MSDTSRGSMGFVNAGLCSTSQAATGKAIFFTVLDCCLSWVSLLGMQTGVVLLSCQTVMCLGLPYALIVLPVTMFHAWQDRQAKKTRQNEPLSNLEMKKSYPESGLESFLAQMTKVQYGRPNLFSIVCSAIGSGNEDVGVFCGGPDTMRQTVNNASYAMRQKCNLFGRLVHYYDESHEL